MPGINSFYFGDERYNYLDEGTFNRVYFNDQETHVLKIYKEENVDVQEKEENVDVQEMVAKRNTLVWNACKRPEIGAANVVTFELEGKQITAMQVPLLPYPKAGQVLDYSSKIKGKRERERARETKRKIITAAQKESIRIFLTTGRIIADGHLNNFLYDEKTNTAHCIDHDLAHDVTLTAPTEETDRKTFSLKPKQKEVFNRNLYWYGSDETGVGRALNRYVADNIIIPPKLSEQLVEDITKQVLETASDFNNIPQAIRTVLYENRVNPLFHVQSDIRAYVNLRLGSGTTLQGVETAENYQWWGHGNQADKLTSLKNLLTSIQQCNPTDKDSLELLLQDIQQAKETNLKSEKGDPLSGLVKQARNMLGRHPGGELGKLLDNCEKHVNDIKADLDKTPTLHH